MSDDTQETAPKSDPKSDLLAIAEQANSMGESTEEELSSLVRVIPKDIFDWLNGETAEQPAEIKKLGDDVVGKTNWFVLYTLLAQFSRVPTLFNFAAQAEAKLFNPDQLQNLEGEELKNKYELARKTMAEVLEFSRKFTLQNKDLLGMGVSEEDQVLLQRIKQLDKPMLEKLLVMIDKAEASNE